MKISADMKWVKKLSIALSFLVLGLFSSNNILAQPKIGTPLPPFKKAAVITPSYSLLQITDLQFDVAPQQLKTPYLMPQYWPPAFNSPVVDEVLTTFAILNRFNSATMPFFCRIEFQMEQQANFPVKFRLGDVQYVDRLEQRVDWELGN